MNQENKKEYSYEEIMAAINKMEPDLVQSLLEIGYSGIEEAVNEKNDKSIDTILWFCDRQIDGYTKLKKATIQLEQMLANEDEEVTTEEIIADMLEKYEGFSREEKLAFNIKLREKNSLLNSVDNLRSAWDRLTETVERRLNEER